MGRNLENLYHRYLHGGVEMVEVHHNGAYTFMRAIPEVKSRGEAAYVTRNNGIKGLKAFGGTPVKHKAEKLWGRFVPAIASDTTTYPMVLENLLDSSDIQLGRGYRAGSGEPSSNAGFSSTRKIIVEPNTSYSTNFNVGSNGTFGLCFYKSDDTFISGKALSTGFATFTTPSECSYIYITTQENPPASGKYLYKGNSTTYVPFGSKWKFVKDIGTNGTGTDFGYYNDATNEFVKAAGASGSLIQPISYADNNGTAYFDLGINIGTSDKVTFDVSWNTLKARPWFGAYNAGGSYSANSFVATYYVDSTSKVFYPNKSGGVVLEDVLANTRYIIKWNGVNTYPTLNGEPFGTGTTLPYPDFTPNVNAYLCARNEGGTVGSIDDMTIYGFEVEGKCDYIPIRIGTSVELLDIISWQFATRVGTFTAGADIPLSQLCPDLIKVNTGDIRYGVGKNLWNYENTFPGTTKTNAGITFTKQNDGGIKCVGTATSQAYTTPYEMINDLEVGKTYRIVAFGNLNPKVNFEVTKNGNRSFPSVYTVDGTEESITAYFYFLTGTIDGTVYLMISEGSVAPTEYEPYAKTIRTNGTHKVIVGSQGVVTFDGSNDENWAYATSSGYTRLIISMAGLANDNSRAILHCSDYPAYGANAVYGQKPLASCWIEDGGSIRFHDAEITSVAEWKAKLQANPITVFYQRNTDSAFVAPQIRDIPMLFSTDSNLDVQSGVKTEKWGVKVLDGTENFSWNTTYNRFGLNGIGEDGTTLTGLCTHYELKSTTVAENDFCFSWSSSGTLHWKDSRFNNDIPGMKAYLASEYAKGTPVIILYPLATPATEQVTIAPVTSARRTTYVADSDSELGKLDVTMEYLGKYGIPQPADDESAVSRSGRIE